MSNTEEEVKLPDVPEEFLGALKYALASEWDEEAYQEVLRNMGL